jgi:hypothetical protein
VIDEHAHHQRIEGLREIARVARELTPELEALVAYLDRLEAMGIEQQILMRAGRGEPVERPPGLGLLRYLLDEDLRLCLDEERALAGAFLDFAKVAIRLAGKQAERKGLSVEEWARILRRTAEST